MFQIQFDDPLPIPGVLVKLEVFEEGLPGQVSNGLGREELTALSSLLGVAARAELEQGRRQRHEVHEIDAV